jgi:hypothetical protein
MGMDLWGRERGSFDVNWGGWHPLVDFIKMFAANEAAPCGDWESNDTPGLNAEDTAKLAAKLKAARDRGAVANFLAIQPREEREYLADEFPALVDKFIAFAEASGGWASMETIVMENVMAQKAAGTWVDPFADYTPPPKTSSDDDGDFF